MFRALMASWAAVALFATVTRAENKGVETELDGLKSRVPASWKKQETKSEMRRAQFLIPREKGDDYDGEFIVFYFSKDTGGGGGPEANITRWKGMMTAPEGKSIDDVSKLEKIKVGDQPVTMLDVKGAYNHKSRPFDPNEKGEKRPDYRLIGMIIERKEGTFYIRITGPAKTIEANKTGIDDWLKGLK